MRRALLLLGVLAALVLVVLPYSILPTALERLAATGVQKELGLSARPLVELESDPQWEVLRGRFSGGRITAKDLDLGGVRAESATIIVDEPFTIDVAESILKQKIQPRGRPRGHMVLELSESEVSNLVSENASIPINGLKMDGEGVTVESEASLLGVTLPITVEGTVEMRGERFVFEPRRAEAAGTALPGWVVDEMLAGGFVYPVDDLPYGAVITGARTTEGALVIHGRVPAVDLGAIRPG